jgi:hypothetical protein
MRRASRLLEQRHIVGDTFVRTREEAPHEALVTVGDAVGAQPERDVIVDLEHDHAAAPSAVLAALDADRTWRHREFVRRGVGQTAVLRPRVVAARLCRELRADRGESASAATMPTTTFFLRRPLTVSGA